MRVFPGATEAAAGVRSMDIASTGRMGAKPRGALLQAIAVQDWLQLVVAIIVAAALAGATSNEFRERPFSLYDATISYPVVQSIIPYWVAVVVPLAAAIISMCAGELLARHRAWSIGFALFLHFLLDFLTALAVTLAVTQALKVSVGRLRPGFLASCQPVVPANGNITVAYGQPASANPACTVPLTSSLVDEHYSFPSGHTSTAFVQAVYSAIYCAWAFSWRLPRAAVASARQRSLRSRLVHDAVALCGMLWIALQISFAWGVGASRIIDFHHHASDVAAGALLGTVFGAVFALRGIGRHPLVLPDREPQQQFEDESSSQHLREFAGP